MAEVQADEERVLKAEREAAAGAEGLSGRLATCRYQNMREEYGNAVCITVGRPRFELHYPLAGEIGRLKPNWTAFRLAKSGDITAFQASYLSQLNRLGVANISQVFKARFPKGRIVLLCYEELEMVPVEKWPLTCHRRLFADWWMQQTGEVHFPELGLRKDQWTDDPDPWKPIVISTP